ncbi:BON domain-containing protein [Undibacterium sp. TJN19]|uniref:BON domain-containing protein n=1 Tax=Undibacterium sp. TJN19 TaxID=3413055 RepID=UPI003BF4FB5E
MDIWAELAWEPSVNAIHNSVGILRLEAGECTDVIIAREVESVIESTCYLPENSIRVIVENAWVTLRGEVEWEFQRNALTQSVSSLTGILGFSNQILIRPEVRCNIAKLDIESTIKQRASHDAQDIVVEVSGGRVTLSGQVSTRAEQDLARQSAWASPGVEQVIDNLTVVNANEGHSLDM